MKYHRWTKRIECDMKVHENFCAIDGGFGNNISDLLRDLLRFLAAEQLDKVKRQLELKIWKIPNVQKPRKLMSAKYLSPLYRDGDCSSLCPKEIRNLQTRKIPISPFFTISNISRQINKIQIFSIFERSSKLGREDNLIIQHYLYPVGKF